MRDLVRFLMIIAGGALIVAGETHFHGFNTSGSQAPDLVGAVLIFLAVVWDD